LELHFAYQGGNVDLSVHTSSSSGSSSNAPAHSALAAALAGLHRLRSLNLQTKWFPVDHVIKVSSSNSSSSSSSRGDVEGSSTLGRSCLLELTELTQLSLGRLWDMQCLQQLPTKLQQLHLFFHEQDDSAQALQLSQLVALTHLSLQGNFVGVAQQDELPAGLKVLHVASCSRCVQPLLRLTQLTQLCVSASRIPAAQLQQLADAYQHCSTLNSDTSLRQRQMQQHVPGRHSR
jgi:hypothetical protein